MKFSLDDVPRLLADTAVAELSRATVEAVFVGSARPLVTALEAASSEAGSSLLLLAAFAASIHGLSCRLTLLPDLQILPEPLAAHCLSEAEQGMVRGRRIVERLRVVLSLLASAGVEAVALKGSALILRGDVEPGLRPMGDLDLLLINLSQVDRAAETLERRTRYRRVLSTPRHLVLAEEGEQVPFPGGEHPDNPLRIELHRSFRLPVLGVNLDASEELRRSTEESTDGLLTLPRQVMLRHLWHHAAEDFAARGIRGIQAVDFLDMARKHGSVSATLHARDAHGAAPLLYAADAVERLFPGTFDGPSLAELGTKVPARLRGRAARLSVLRHSRSPYGWTKSCLAIAPGPIAKARFLMRTAFPTLGEVKANVAPGANGYRLAMAWLWVLTRRVRSFFRP